MGSSTIRGDKEIAGFDASNRVACSRRAAADPTSLVPSIRAQLQSLDANLPMTFMQTMEDILEESFADRRFGMRLLSAFGSMALLLTAIGLYGVMTAAVSDRTREIAVRLALGAPATRIVRMVVGQTFVVVTAGLAAGVGVALGTMRYVEPLLFGVARTDPTIYAETAAIHLAVTLVSAWLPSRRIVRVNPVITPVGVISRSCSSG